MYLESVNQFFEQVQYVPLPDGAVQEARERFNDRVTGTAPEDALGGEAKGKSEEEQKK